jgi:hypothetical protein
MDERLAAKERELDERAPVEFTKREALILIASLHSYLESIEQAAAADAYRVRTREYVAESRHTLGQLIWRLEDAAAWPRKVGEHSAEAVPPN